MLSLLPVKLNLQSNKFCSVEKEGNIQVSKCIYTHTHTHIFPDSEGGFLLNFLVLITHASLLVLTQHCFSFALQVGY